MQMNGERLLLCKSCILSIGVGKSILCKDCVKKLLPSICLKCLKTLSSKRWISVEFADEIHFSRWDFKWKVDYDLVKDVLCSSCLSHYPAPLDTQEQFKKQQKVAASKIKIKNIKAMLDEKAAHHTGKRPSPKKTRPRSNPN